MRSSRLLTTLILGAFLSASPIAVHAAEPRAAPASAAPAVPQFAKPVISAKDEAALRKRANDGVVDAQFELGLLLFHRMLASKIPFDGYDEVIRWFTLAEQNGSVLAKARLSFMIVWGTPSAGGRDFARAFRLAEEGAAANDPLALDLLSSMYGMGQGVAKDETKAVLLLVRAADAGSVNAQVDVAKRYLIGNKLDKDPVKGEHYFELAALQGDRNAQTILGSLYASNNQWGVPKNAKYAVHWLTAAANENHAPAQYQLGALLCDGMDDVKANVAKAKALLRKAIAQGHQEAREALKECGVKR